MIRPLVMVLGFVSSTVALLWALTGEDRSLQSPDQVSRSNPDVMGLQPALNPVSAPEIEEASGEVSTDIDQRPEIGASVVSPAVSQVAPRTQSLSTAVQASTEDRVGGAIEAMGYGILEELKKPVAARSAEPAPVQTARVAPTPTANEATRTYTVQAGDSLPGIAFRFYGTTVAYLQILEANQEVVRNPADLRAGMVLTIPE